MKAQLTAWGRARRAPPGRNDALKQELLSRVVPQPTIAVPVRSSMHSRWFLPLAFAGAAAIAMVIGPVIPTVRTPTLPTTAPPSSITMPVTGTGESTALKDEASSADDMGTAVGFSRRSASGLAAPRLQTQPVPDILPYPREVPIVDQRELLKIDYHATARTRKVMEIGQRLQTTIRGYGGRIDTATISETYGSIGFALPVDKLDAFRQELRSTMGARFLVEQVRTENRVGTQRSLEEQQRMGIDEIDALAREREETIATFQRREGGILREITAIGRRIEAIRAELAAADAATRPAIEVRLRDAERERARFRQQLAGLRTAHAREIQQLDTRLTNAQHRVDRAVDGQQDLTEDVATVRGWVGIERIGIAGIIGAYLRGYWVAIILGVLALAALARAWRGTDRTPLVPMAP